MSILGHQQLTLYFDGSGTPGGVAGYGFVITTRAAEKRLEQKLHQDSGVIEEGPGATNNKGEWGALQKGLEYLKEQGWTNDLLILGDSQLVVFQMTGYYQCRKPHLIVFRDKCRELVKDLKCWEIRWIPRAENSDADLISR